ncbi:MAG: isoprenylcysteine carboxylmethyltransferase family protein [Thermoplasmata archaeon]|nr:MAG: isoprenylcysteine carboxylmethyltransferase family protein [Thermoplasmata archaeon]
MIKYTPPKTLRGLFITHYAPLLLIIMIGPQTAFLKVYMLPTPWLLTISIGLIIFLTGAILYFKWEYFWYKTYRGQLVTTGIFRYIRHPHYTSILIIGFGLALFFYSLLALILAIVAIPIMIWSILDEEKYLIKEYGDEYREFMKKTPWRMIPGVF